MTKLIKYMKQSAFAVFMILALLVVQAICDLSLPDYTSRIVNVGIQQGGVDTVAPEVIRQSQMEKVTLFLSEQDAAVAGKYYLPLTRENLGDKQYEAYVKQYPQAAQEQLLYRATTDAEEIETLNQIFAMPFMIVSGMENNSGEMAAVKEKMMAQLAAGQSQTPDMQRLASNGEADLISMLSHLPQAQRDQIRQEIDASVSAMPESIIQQAATMFTKAEYTACGADTGWMQNRYVLVAGGKMLVLALISMIATILVSFLGAKVSARLGRDLRGRVFGKVVSFSNTEFDKFSTASLITRSTNDIQQVQMMMVMLLRIVFYAPIMAVGGVIKVLHTNTSMAWIIAVAVMVILAIIGLLFGIVMPKFKLVQKLIDKVNLVTREILTGLPVIRAFSTEKYEEKRFDKANRDLTKTNLFVNRMMSGMMPMMMLVMNGVSILIVWNGAHGIDTGAMQVGDMVAFIQYTMQIIMAFLMISMLSVMLPRASVAAGRIDEVIRTEVSVKDKKQPQVFDSGAKGEIEFKNVGFQYPGADEEVLSNVSFVAKPGETTAFIGSTGSGKSTLINLIPRFYDVTSGQILIDGKDISSVSQHALREKIGYVPQKGMLFSGTIESNIKYGDENLSDERMQEAALVAQAKAFIEEKPQGYQSEISQGGTNVSGGQKQRLSIARAVAIHPEIYIFDDSFSALDYKTDSMLRKALKEYTAESTVLIVAQRISTILHAQQIIVLDEGKIVGKGTHQQLLKDCEVYQQIALSQLSKEELCNE